VITLHVYLNPKPGRRAELESRIRDRWIAAMSEQPGFISAAVLTPFPDAALDALSATRPGYEFEVVSLWRSEKERLEWVARPIHDEVFVPVTEAAADLSFTLKNVSHSWNL
jgi:heme-degrading monooxygenase HmoA